MPKSNTRKYVGESRKEVEPQDKRYSISDRSARLFISEECTPPLKIVIDPNTTAIKANAFTLPNFCLSTPFIQRQFPAQSLRGFDHL